MWTANLQVLLRYFHKQIVIYPMLQIRKYHPSDWDSICEVHDLSRPGELKGTVPKEAFIALKDAAKNEGLFDGELFVGTVENRIIGFIAWEPGEITWLYIHPKFQRQGFGTELLQFAISKLTTQIEISVLAGNKKALSLYKNEGFEIIRKKKGKLVGNEQFSAEGYRLARRPIKGSSSK